MTPSAPPSQPAPHLGAHPSVHDEVHWDLLATARRVIRARWRILLCGLAGGLLGIALALATHPYYTASAVFLPPHNTDTPASVPTSLGSIVAGENSDVYLGMLTSRSVADDVIERLDLMHEFGTPTRTDARAALARASSFFVSKSAMINVSVTCGKPELAAAIANEYLNSLFRLNSQMVSSGYGYRRIFFEGQLAEQKKILDGAEADLKNTQEATGVLLPQGEAQAGLNATATLQAQIGNAEASLAALLTGSTEQNPEVIRARSQLAQLRAQLSGQLASTPRGQGIASNGRLPELSLEYTQKARAVRLDEAEYDALVKRYDTARLASIDPGPQLQIVDRAVVPERKAGPSRRNITAIGLFLGLLAGFLYVLAAGLLRRFLGLLREPPSASAR